MLPLKNYLSQKQSWPAAGRHILAHYDEQTVIVYQAYKASIAKYALEKQQFGGEFSFERMSWIKPNYLWMMYRSGWGSKENQEYILGVRIRRSFFNQLLRQAVHSKYIPEVYFDPAVWRRRLKSSGVRLQWDPDHGPRGNKLERRAIQLGLRGVLLKRYAQEALVEVLDMSDCVRQGREALEQWQDFLMPTESVYPVSDPQTRSLLGLDIG